MVFIASALFSVASLAKKQATNLNKPNGINSNSLIKQTFSTGGGKMSGNNYVVISSIGQIDAGHITTGGGQQFIGGILAAPRNNELFKDDFE